MSKVNQICVRKVHVAGTCSCTLATQDPSGKLLNGSTNEVVIVEQGTGKVIENKGPLGAVRQETTMEVQPMPQPKPEPTVQLKVTAPSPFKFICTECNMMINVDASMFHGTCKCGNEFAAMVKRGK